MKHKKCGCYICVETSIPIRKYVRPSNQKGYLDTRSIEMGYIDVNSRVAIKDSIIKCECGEIIKDFDDVVCECYNCGYKYSPENLVFSPNTHHILCIGEKTRNCATRYIPEKEIKNCPSLKEWFE